MGHSTFQVGQRITWAPEYLARQGDFGEEQKERYGEGPFTVQHVQPVSTTCTCGAASVKHSPHHEQCAVYTIGTSVGHHQWVTISPQGPVREFSGAWFIPA